MVQNAKHHHYPLVCFYTLQINEKIKLLFPFIGNNIEWLCPKCHIQLKAVRPRIARATFARSGRKCKFLEQRGDIQEYPRGSHSTANTSSTTCTEWHPTEMQKNRQ